MQKVMEPLFPGLMGVKLLELSPERVLAEMVVRHFAPVGRCLDPCRGDGAFHRLLPDGAQWCEIAEGRDFFSWGEPVDWVIGNPPY